MIHRGYGLGQLLPTCPTGQTVNVITGECTTSQPWPNWYCGSFLSDIFGSSGCYPAPTAQLTSPAGPATVVQETQPGAWTTDQAVAATAAAQRAGLQQFYASVAQANQPVFSLPSFDPSTWNIGTWLLIGGGILLAGWILNDLLGRR